MIRFTSGRESRLWLGAGAVFLGIGASLGFSGALASLVAQEAVATAVFVLGGVVVLIAILTHGLTLRPHGIESFAAAGIGASALLALARIATPAQRTHLIEYGVLALFLYEALEERRSRGARSPAPSVTAILSASMIGTLDEGIQLFLPARVFSVMGLLFNLIAAVVAVVASTSLRWIRRRSSPGRPVGPDGDPRR